MSVFSNADLTGARLEGAVGRHAMFMGTVLQEARLACADLAKSFFGEADLSRADLSAADLSNCVFEKAVGRAAVFKNACCRFADFSQADLTAADFSGADLFLARMHRTITEHAIWEGADRALLRGEDEDLAEAENWPPGLS
jgi:uncharacterized protein YjbI with pentapeptide repeats